MMRKLNVCVDSFLFCSVLSFYSIVVSSRAEDEALVIALYAGKQRFVVLWSLPLC